MSIRRNEHIEALICQAKQLAILLSGPTNLWNGANLVVCEVVLQLPRQRLVK